MKSIQDYLKKIDGIPVATYYVPSKREWGKRYEVELFEKKKDRCECYAVGKCTHIKIARAVYEYGENKV